MPAATRNILLLIDGANSNREGMATPLKKTGELWPPTHFALGVIKGKGTRKPTTRWLAEPNQQKRNKRLALGKARTFKSDGKTRRKNRSIKRTNYGWL